MSIVECKLFTSNEQRMKFILIRRIFCSPTESTTPTVRGISLDDNAIESISTDPFQFCNELKIISIANNSIQRLENGNFDIDQLHQKMDFSIDFLFLDFLTSAIALEHLNISHNKLIEFHKELLTSNSKLKSLDVSFNRIKQLKLDEVIVDSKNNKLKKIH